MDLLHTGEVRLCQVYAPGSMTLHTAEWQYEHEKKYVVEHVSETLHFHQIGMGRSGRRRIRLLLFANNLVNVNRMLDSHCLMSIVRWDR